jgi:hypothetical protein
VGSLISYFHLPVLLHLLKLANQRRLAALYQRALAALFRGKFLSGLSQMLDEEGLHVPDSDIADMRPLIQICSTPSAFTNRDYLHGSQLKELTLSVLEFSSFTLRDC